MRNNIKEEYHYRRKYLNGIVPDSSIYKYIPLEYVLKMIENKSIRFNKVNTWEDVFENYFLKQDFWTKKGIYIGSSDISDRIYGQSWTLIEESDAMWRIYSPLKNSLRVKTSVEKLMDVLYTDDRCMATTSIANVNYRDQKDIEIEFEELSSKKMVLTEHFKDWFNFVTDSLITKRLEFEHEKEVRIIKILPTTEYSSEYLDMPIDPFDFFEEFTIDPRVSDTTENTIRKILETMGIDSHKINKSKLYSLKKYKLILT